jgi:6,7-dimethyl-8-ribityllumazine synthase
MSTNLKNLSDFSHTEIPDAKKFRFGIAVAQWNAEITSSLLNGAIKALKENGAREENIEVVYVPGSFELSAACYMLAETGHFDAVIGLGCVIQGETPHFDFICNAVANGMTNVALNTGVPAIFGVLTTLSQEQAKERAGGKHGNKGEEAGVTAIIMASVRKKLS